MPSVQRALGLSGRVLLFAHVVIFQLGDSGYAQATTSVNLAWDPNTESFLAGYNVYRSEDGVFSSPPLNGTSLVGSTSFTDSTVEYGRTYYYAVTAVSTTGAESDFSNEVRFLDGTLEATNQPPTVDAGPDQTITLPSAASLSATATDDGLPSGILTYQWSAPDGSGVSFSSPNSANTEASFAAAGTYTVRVTVSDGELSAAADVAVVVNPEPTDTTETTEPAPELTLVVSREGEVLRGRFTPIQAWSEDDRVRRLELYIDGRVHVSVDGNYLDYKWDTRNLSGDHRIEAVAYDSTGVVASASATVTVR